MDKIAVIILCLMAFGVLLRVFVWICGYLSLRKKLSSIPGPKSPLFLGLMMEIRKIPSEDLLEYFLDKSLKFKNGMIVMWLGMEPTVTIRKPQQMEVILRSNTLIRKSKIYEFFAYWLGNGLLTSTGDVWHRHRRLLTPAFHFTILEQFTHIIDEKIELFNKCIKMEIEKNPETPINIFPMTIKFTLDTICKTVMGVDMDIQKQEENDYVKAISKFAHLTIYRFIRPILRWDFVFDWFSYGKEYRDSINTMHAFSMKVIKEKYQLWKKNKAMPSVKVNNGDEDDHPDNRKHKIFLELLMDLSEADENPLTVEEIREQVDTFMFGGHDTTGIAITWALFSIGNDPEVQRKIHQELDYVFEDENEPATKEQLSQLKYLDRVIKESLRKYPSAPIISRTLNHDTVIDDHVIPKGIMVSMQIFHLHHDPEVWEDPETFDPDRFLPENSHGRHPFSYIPFSAGPRNCIGQKFAGMVLKRALTAIMRKWEIKSERKPSEMKMQAQIVLTPINRYVGIYFKPRSDKK